MKIGNNTTLRRGRLKYLTVSVDYLFNLTFNILMSSCFWNKENNQIRNVFKTTSYHDTNLFRDICKAHKFIALIRGVLNNAICLLCVSFFFFKDCIYLFLGRGDGREKERERNIDWVPLIRAQTGDRTSNPGMYTVWESKWQLFTWRDNTQPTEPHRSGLCFFIYV